MPMLRSGSAKSTLSMMQRRTTKYQKFLNLSNVFLLITSTILLFSSVILMKFYHMEKLSFWSPYFFFVPVLMDVLGVITFIVCVYGFVISGSENRALLALYAVLLSVTFLGQLASIFSAMELRNVISNKDVATISTNDEINQYGIDETITSNWDVMHQDLNCCGAGHGSTFGNAAFRDFASRPDAMYRDSVPDSCCYEPSEGCGKNLLTNRRLDEIANKIPVVGCLPILQQRFERDVEPMMIIYACIGVVLAIVELITVVLACAYIAQITRKINREDKMWRHGTADHDGHGDQDATDHLNHDTMV